jgi:hypothetical protein
MTLQDLFDLISRDPSYVIFYFVAMPLIALLVGFMSEGEGHLSPWRNVYSALIYMVCVPGVFSLTLLVYNFFFERQSFLQLNIFVYFLPLLSMLLTLLLIKRKVSFDNIPGFDKITGLLMVIMATFVAMLLIQKTHIWVVFVGSIGHLAIAFVVLFLIIRFGMKRLFNT